MDPDRALHFEVTLRLLRRLEEHARRAGLYTLAQRVQDERKAEQERWAAAIFRVDRA